MQSDGGFIASLLTILSLISLQYKKSISIISHEDRMNKIIPALAYISNLAYNRSRNTFDVFTWLPLLDMREPYVGIGGKIR